jgi:hypothetical protein
MRRGARPALRVCCLIAAVALLVRLFWPGVVRAETLPTFSLRELVIRGDLVVVARPLDPPYVPEGATAEQAEKPVRFEVLDVLKGSAAKAGDTILVGNMALYRLGKPWLSRDERAREATAEIEKGLLSICVHDKDGETEYSLLVSGARYLTTSKQVLYPVQFMNPGGYCLVPEKDADWASLLQTVREDAAVVEHVMALRRIEDASERNRALMQWIREHRDDAGGGMFLGSKDTGWGSLQVDVLGWIMDSCIPIDCWDAIKLAVDIYPGARSVPDSNAPSFGSRAGRQLLLNIAMDERAPLDDRVIAFGHLGSRSTLWPHGRTDVPQLARLDRKEQSDLIEEMIPLLSVEEPRTRAAVVRIIYAASHPADGALKEFETKQALPDLVSAYEAEPPGTTRDLLARAVREIGGADYWRELTGNPRGILVLLDGLDLHDGEVSFWLDMECAFETVYERPQLVLERLDDEGGVAERKEMPLPATYMPKPWSEGWDGAHAGNIEVRFSCAELTPGAWRVTVKGTAGQGDDRVSWVSEPKTFVVQPNPVETNDE